MKKIFLFMLAGSFVFLARAYADDTYEQRMTFREDMADEARDDYAGFQQLSDQRRNLSDRGWTSHQIRTKQQAEINARRLPPQEQTFGESAFTPPPAGTNAAFSGFSTPKTRKGGASEEKPAVPVKGDR